jgi:hypothetical protein
VHEDPDATKLRGAEDRPTRLPNGEKFTAKRKSSCERERAAPAFAGGVAEN